LGAREALFINPQIGFEKVLDRFEKVLDRFEKVLDRILSRTFSNLSRTFSNLSRTFSNPIWGLMNNASLAPKISKQHQNGGGETLRMTAY
jgi:hypothetical protein